MSKATVNNSKHPQPAKPAIAQPSTGDKSAATSGPAIAAATQPKTWGEIRIGSLVVAQERPAEGWWEATVTEVRDDFLTLRWQGYPRLPAFVRNRKQVGLLHPAD